MRVLVTGMSGVGKSTLVDALRQRGRAAVDTDYGPWKADNGNWRVGRMTELLDAHPDIVVAGTVENQGQFYELFDHIVLLSRLSRFSSHVSRREPTIDTARRRASRRTFATTSHTSSLSFLPAPPSNATRPCRQPLSSTPSTSSSPDNSAFFGYLIASARRCST